ncbi:hypothetical protein FO519_002278 [Halicephalobus sp. NKZ332]|nr:hypothetical protein FO519_002278 [Halicephalobus sp. NKZ332]
MIEKLLILALCVQVTVACFGLGGCGGCGMSCGRYCARAKGARTLAVGSGDVVGTRKYQNPDEEFFACCRDRGLPDACTSKCNYRSYTASSLRSMFFRLDACPIEAASAIHFCASGGKDHRTCCGRNGVGATEAGARCFIFCDEEPRNRTQLDLSFLPCLERFDQMKQCFYSDSVQSKQPTFPYYRNPLPQSPIHPSGYPSQNPSGYPSQNPSVYTNQFGLQRYDGAVTGPQAGVKPLQPLAVSLI